MLDLERRLNIASFNFLILEMKKLNYKEVK